MWDIDGFWFQRFVNILLTEGPQRSLIRTIPFMCVNCTTTRTRNEVCSELAMAGSSSNVWLQAVALTFALEAVALTFALEAVALTFAL